MSTLLVETTYGPILGFQDTFPLQDKSSFSQPCHGQGGGQDPVLKWLGIPYGQAKRWKRPVAPAPWSEPLLCTEFGPYFPQASDLLDQIYQGKSGYFSRTAHLPCEEEHGFNLNVFAPADTKPGDDLAVMVWIHGGSLESGPSSSLLYDPTEWIRSQGKPGCIVVTGNYRTNILGFMACHDLAEEDEGGLAGNYGAYDCISMLEWVQGNIKSFGGNPDNVTIFGESAGGFLVGALLVTQRKLFRRAIMQSGFPGSMKHLELDSGSGDAVYRALLEKHPTLPELRSPERLEFLRNIPQDELVSFMTARGSVIKDYGITNENPSNDASIWTKPTIELIKEGRWNQNLECVLLGTTKDEGSLFAYLFDASKKIGLEFLLNTLSPWCPRKTIDELYPNNELETDWIHCAGSRLVKEQVFESPLEEIASVFNTSKNLQTDELCKVYRYRLDASIEDNRGWGCFHTVDVPLTFNIKSMWKPDSSESKVAHQIGKSWFEFARTGSPAPDWPQYTTVGSQVYIFRENGECIVENLNSTRSQVEQKRIAFWIDKMPYLISSQAIKEIEL